MKKNNLKIAILAILILMILVYFFRGRITLPRFTGSADLSWSASSDEGIAGYKIYYGENPRTSDCPPGGYPKNIDAKNKTNQKIDSLTESHAYYFSVTSYNKKGRESCFSEEGRKTIALGRWQKIKSALNKVVGR
jgi:hypothetical protein